MAFHFNSSLAEKCTQFHFYLRAAAAAAAAAKTYALIVICYHFFLSLDSLLFVVVMVAFGSYLYLSFLLYYFVVVAVVGLHHFTKHFFVHVRLSCQLDFSRISASVVCCYDYCCYCLGFTCFSKQSKQCTPTKQTQRKKMQNK